MGALALGAVLLALGIAGATGDVQAVGEDPAAEVTEALRSLGPPGLRLGPPRHRGGVPRGGLDAAQRDPGHPLPGHARPRRGARTDPAERADVRRPVRVGGGRGSRRPSPPTRAASIARAAPLPSPGQGLVAEPPLVAAPRAAKPAASPGTGVRSAPGSARRRRSRPSGGAERRPRGAPESRRTRGARRRTRPGSSRSPRSRRATGWSSRSASRRMRRRRSEPSRRPGSPVGHENFLPRAGAPAKEAELWVTRVRVVAGERVGLNLTDRARWLVGPLR